MSAARRHPWRARRRAAVALTLALGALAQPGSPPDAVAAKRRAEPAPETALPAVREIGAAWERLRVPGPADPAALDSLQRLLDASRDADDSGSRFARRMLSGDLAFARGDGAVALAEHRRAADAAGSGPFADDAAFAVIRSLEAAGQDAEAAKAWMKWEKEHGAEPLAAEALLAQSWNALRNGRTAEARARLERMVKLAPWRAQDPRVQLARAAVSLREGRADEAIATLGSLRTGAACHLRGCAYAARGLWLKAAAQFQEAGEKLPPSPLRDHARLAKAEVFLAARDWRSAALEFDRAAPRIDDPGVRAEAELRAAGARAIAGDTDSALVRLRDLASRHDGAEVGARARFLTGETLARQGRHSEAILELNQVLARSFSGAIAASAQYQVARSLDALGRRADATGAYQAVVTGYPLEPEAPAAAYLAGVGLLDQRRPRAAATYFQIVVDRYAQRADSSGIAVFAEESHRELTEAALCLLMLSYHRAGDLGQMSGAPHVMLGKLPPSRSPWRGWSLLLDADALASQGRHAEAQAQLDRLTADFPDHAAVGPAQQLLAWTLSRQGRDSLAITVQERLLARGGVSDDVISGALLDIAHERFNQKRYAAAAAAYEDFLARFPVHPKRLQARYQAGLCYARLDRSGDAVDRWESIVRDSAAAAVSERAWARMGDAYFQAGRYPDAKRAYEGLLANFEGSTAASIARLRIAQCAYNGGQDAAALEAFAVVVARHPGTAAEREARRGTELALYRLGRTSEGARELQQLLEKYPDSPFAADAQFQIGRRHYEAQRWEPAAEAFRAVVSGFPGYSAADQAQYLLAEALARAGRADEAQRAWEQFASFFPESELRPAAEFRFGLLAFESGDHARAAVAFTRVLSDSASDQVRSAARFNLALCHRAAGRPDEARAELEAHAAEFPSDPRAAEVALQLGDLEEQSGRPERAIPLFERALARDPAPALAVELRYRLGHAHEALSQTEPAIESYRLAMASPRRDDAWRLSAVARLAALYEQRKEWSRALTAYRDIVQNARDRELAAAAAGRVSVLESAPATRRTSR